MMTLDEAIEHSTEKAANEKCKHCAEEHAQLALWLMELRVYKSKYELGNNNGKID